MLCAYFVCCVVSIHNTGTVNVGESTPSKGLEGDFPKAIV